MRLTQIRIFATDINNPLEQQINNWLLENKDKYIKNITIIPTTSKVAFGVIMYEETINDEK